MKFTQKSQEHRMYFGLETPKGCEVQVAFNYNDSWPESISLDDSEYEPEDNRLFDIYVDIDNKFVSLQEIMDAAAAEYQPMYEEIQRENYDEESMRLELSSPQSTGRI